MVAEQDSHHPEGNPQRELPDSFYTGRSRNNIEGDYGNAIFSGINFPLTPFRYPNISSQVNIERARRDVKIGLLKVQTYFEYWQERTEQYNRTATQTGEPTVDFATVKRVVIDGVANTERLDEIARALRALADRDVPAEDLIPEIDRYHAEYRKILFGEPEQETQDPQTAQ